MMNNLQSSAQVAKNLLNVLQGYTKGIRFVAVLTMLLSLGIGQAWGETIVSWSGAKREANTKYDPTTSQTDNSTAQLKSECTLSTAGTGGSAGSYYGTWTNDKCIYVTGLNLSNYKDISLTVYLRRRNGTCTASFYTSTDGSTYAATALTTKTLSNTLTSYTVTGIQSNVKSIKILITGGSGNLWLGTLSFEGTKATATPIDVTLHYKGIEETLSNKPSPYTLPTTGDYVGDACDGWEFAGWYGSEYAKSETEPTYISQLTSPGDAYAVYSHTETTGGGTSTNTTTDNIFSNGIFANNIITWTLSNVVSIKQERNGDSNSAVANYTDAPRWYKGHKITITPSVDITKITVVAQSGYADELVNATFTNATASYSSNTVTITPENGRDPITIVMGAQARLSTLTVTYSGGGSSSTTYYSTTPDCTTETVITLNPNGGTIGDNKWTLENDVYKLTTEDESITLPTITRTGYTFGGWATSSDGTKEHNANATINLDGTPVTLHAIWTANIYNITYKDQGNVDFSGTHEGGYPTQHTYGIETTLKGATKIGYTFEGWHTDAACTNKVTTLGATEYTGDITLYAKWEEIPTTCTITYDANGGKGTITDATEYANGAKVTVKGNFGIFTKDGYAFTGWNTQADGSGDSYKHNDQFTITTNTTLYAQWCKAHWKLVTDVSEIENDTRIVIAAKDFDFALSTTQNTNNRDQAAITKKYNTIVFEDYVQVLSLVGLEENRFALYTGSGYLYAAGSDDNNYLKTRPSINGNCYWSIAISQIVADIHARGAYQNNQIKYNKTSELFSCYGEDNNQKDVVIYKEVCVQDQYNVTSTLTNTTATNTNPTTVAATATTLTLKYSANTRYLLPETIIVKMGGVELVSGTDYTWNKEDGTLTFSVTGFYGDIDVEIVSDADPCYQFEMSTVTATSNTPNTITLTWTEVEGATGYNVKIGTGDFTPANGLTHTFEGLSPKTTYDWEVQAVKDGPCEASKSGSTTTQKESFTITWNAAGETTTTIVVDGDAVVLPSAPTSSCSDTYTTFVGWYTMASGMETNPSDTPQGQQVTASTVPTDNTTYYAVWADAAAGEGEWEKVTSFEIGDVVIFVNEASSKEMSDINLISSNTCGIASNYTTNPVGTYPLTIEVGYNGTGYSFKTSDNKYLSWSSGNTLIKSETKNDASSWTIHSNTDGNFKFANIGTAERIMQYNTNSPRWACYTSSQTTFQIYKQASSATGYISSCCQSQAVVTVTPENDNLKLDIEGTASTTVNISQTDGGDGEFIANVDGSAKLEATNNATDNPYTLNFTATEAGEYIINGTFTDNAYDCPKYGSATITVAANPILLASASELTFSPTCGQNSASLEVEINSRYLTSNSIIATVATTSGSGKFTISTDNTNFGISNLTLSGGTTTKVTDQIYVRYEAEEGETGAVAGTLTLKCGSTQQVINLTGTCTCSANVTITGAPIQITAAKGVWVEAATELTVTGTFLTTNADNANVSIRAYTNNAAFQIKKGGVTGEGAPKTASNNALTLNTDGAISTADWTGNIGIVYKPTQANTTETATLTVEVYRHNGSTIYSTATYELEGRSLPEQFVIAVTNGSGDWFAVPADMVAPWGESCSGLGTFAPYPISVDNNATPTMASDVPARAVYQAAARTGNVNTNPQTMSYKSVPLGGNYYLYGSSTSVESDGSNTNIQNASFATSEKQKWFLDVVDWNTKKYNMHLHSNLTTNVLAYTTASGANRVGQYSATAGTTKKSIYLLPINGTTCTYYAVPVVTVMAIDATNATIQFKNDRTTAYEISLDQNTWIDLPVTLIKDCNNSEEATLLQAQLPLATYRGKTVYIRAKVTTGTACQETGSFLVPNPTINRGETPWRYTGMAGQAFSDNSKSVTISDLWNPLSVSVVQQVTGSNIQASITPEGVVTVSMAAEDATEGDHKAVLEFTSAGAETKQVAVVITLHNLALQEFDGGSYAFTDGTPKVFCENYIYEDIIAWKPEIHLSHALYMGGATISTTDQLNNTNFTLIDLNTGESLSFTREVISGGIAKITLNATCRSKMVPGHTYRLSWENTNQVMTDENGLPYMDCHMDFVYSENCDAPTALAACPITNSGFTANWAPVADCTGDVTVDVYTKQNAVLQEYNFTTSGSTTISAWSQRGTAKWFIGGTGVQDKTTNGYEMLSTNGGYNVYSPQLSNWKSDITTDDEVKITLVGYNNRTDATTYALKLYVVENANMPTSAGKPTTFKTVTINGQSTNVYTLTLAAGRVQSTGVFTIKGLSATDRFFITSSASSSNCLLTSIKMESSAKTPIASKTIACNAGSAEFTSLSANTTYYYTVGDGNGNNSNEIAVTTYSGVPSLKYYSDEACTTEITETKVLGGEETTVYVKGTNISACELVPSVTTGYAYDDSGLSYTPSTGDVSGKIILTVTDPANTVSGTLTIAGYPLDLISSDCPAGFNNMAKDATDVTSNSAQANWNRGLNFGDDPSGTLLLYENGEVFVELVENGDFETGSLTDGWSSSIHTGPSDGNKAFNDYELVDNSLYITDNAGCGTLANFHNMTLMYANYVTLKPGTYRMKAQVKVPEVNGNTDKEKIFAIGLVQSGLSVVAVSPEETVLSNNTYVEIIYEFELANEVTVCPAIGARQEAGEFRKFYIDNVSLMRIKCPGPGDLVREIPITDLGTGFEDIEGLKPNTEYTYVIKNVNDCESNEITFYTGQGNYMPMQVVEWKENSVVVMYTGSETNAIVMIGSNNPKTVALTQQDVAIYELLITDLIKHPTEKLYITIGEGFKAVTIPYIISTTKDEDDLTTNRDLARTSDIVILNEGKLNITKTGNAAYQFHDITIYGGGKMIVEGEVKIASLTMRIGAVVNRAHQALYPQLVLKGQITNSSRQINLDYLTTYDRYYALSVPYPVLTESIHYPADIYGDNLKTGNTASFALQWYDGEARASETRKGWTDLEEPATLTPYQGYTFWGAPRKVNGVRPTYGIHRIPMPVEDLKIKNNETSGKEINVYAHSAANAYDAGWNFIGNPYLAQYGNMEDGHTSGLLGMLTQNPETGVWEHTGNYRYITLTDDGKTYWQTPVSEAELYPFNTFFVQAGENGAVSFNASNRASLPARHYAAQQEAAKEITTGILLTGNDQTDRTGLLIADNFTEEYEFNADLSKFENSGINLYTIGKTGKLAYMAINQALAEQPIPVGYSAPAEGLYTIAFDEDRYNATDISALYLIDYDSNEKTNLLHTDYSFVTAAGTNNQRFALQVAFAPENATNIEWVGYATVQVGVEGNTLMLNNLPTDAAVHIFDALGRLMYHAPTVPTEMQLILPTGYYLVRIADKQNAVVIKTVIP